MDKPFGPEDCDQGKKWRHVIKEDGKFLDKIPVTFAFNALHQLNWPH